MAKKPKKAAAADWLDDGIAATESQLAAESAEWSAWVKESEKDPTYQASLSAIEAYRKWDCAAIDRLEAIDDPRRAAIAQDVYEREANKKRAELGLPLIEKPADEPIGEAAADPIPTPEPEQPKKKRPGFDRDHEWLRQYEAEGEPTNRSPATIRREWNAKNPRALVKPETVKKGIKKARLERDAQKKT